MVPTKSVTPKISLITLTYNSEAYLKKCLASVSNQTFRDFEHLFIDGHSTDQTLQILAAYRRAAAYSVRLISAAPRGISAGMNEGIKHARGEYLYFLHSDDSLYAHDTLAQVAAHLARHPSLDWVFGRIHEVGDNGQTIGFPPRQSFFHHPRPWLLPFYNYIPHQAVFMKKKVFAQHGGFDESLKAMMDDELWLRVSRLTRWAYMPLVVANYSLRHNTQSGAAKNQAQNDAEWASLQARYLRPPLLLLAKAMNLLLR